MMRRTKNVRKGGSVGLKGLAPLCLSLKISAQVNNLSPSSSVDGEIGRHFQLVLDTTCRYQCQSRC